VLRTGHVATGWQHRDDHDRVVVQVFPVSDGVPAVRPSAVVLATRGGLAALASTPVEQDLDASLAEEPDAGPEEKLGLVPGDDQENSNVASFATIDRGRRGRAPRAEDLEHVLPADSEMVE
jgi:hypothetical protein